MDESVPMSDAALKPPVVAPVQRAGVPTLPLPLSGAYDYRVAQSLPRARWWKLPLGGRSALGVVWNGDGGVVDAKLKEAVPLDGAPRLPESLCDFVDWVARYTLSPPGMILAMALRAKSAFEDEIPRTALSVVVLHRHTHDTRASTRVGRSGRWLSARSGSQTKRRSHPLWCAD